MLYEEKAVLVSGEHDNFSELTRRVAMNLTSICKTALMQYGHEIEHSAWRVDVADCHAKAQPSDSQDMDYLHLVEIDLAQDISRGSNRSIMDHHQAYSIWLATRQASNGSWLWSLCCHASTNLVQSFELSLSRYQVGPTFSGNPFAHVNVAKWSSINTLSVQWS